MRRQLLRLCWILVLAALVGGCTQASMPLPSPTVDYAAMETAIEDKISSGSLSLSTINAVLVSVGGETKVASDLTQSVLSLSHLSTSYDVAAIARHD